MSCFESNHEHFDEGHKNAILGAKANTIARNLETRKLLRENIQRVSAQHQRECEHLKGCTPAEHAVARPGLHSCVAEIVRNKRELATLRQESLTLQRQMLAESTMTPKQLELRLPRVEPKKPLPKPKGSL